MDQVRQVIKSMAKTLMEIILEGLMRLDLILMDQAHLNQM